MNDHSSNATILHLSLQFKYTIFHIFTYNMWKPHSEIMLQRKLMNKKIKAGLNVCCKAMALFFICRMEKLGKRKLINASRGRRGFVAMRPYLECDWLHRSDTHDQ